MTKTISNPQGGTPAYKLYQSGSLVSTAAYAQIGIQYRAGYKKTLIYLRETGGAESFMYRIQLGITQTILETIKTDVSVAASGTAYETLTDAWPWVKVDIIDDSGHATVWCYIVSES